MGDAWSYKSLAAALVAGEIETAVGQLEEQICARLCGERPAVEARRIVEELRALGHDLWSFDEDDELQVWVGNPDAIRQEYNLVVQFNYPADGAPSVEASFGPWPK